MAEKLSDRLKHAWNAFISNDKDDRRANQVFYQEPSIPFRPGKVGFSTSDKSSFMASIYTRIAVDAAAIDWRHARVDEDNRFLEDVSSGLHRCLNIEANMDQGATAFKQDVIYTMLENGTVVTVPVDTTLDPRQTGGYDIQTLRAGIVVDWYPSSVKVRVYDERAGEKKELILSKKMVSVVENPLYSVMNEKNSTLQRLVTKLAYLDAIDKQSGSGKLDLIIQLPYVIKSEAREKQAEKRKKDIEMQLAGSQYGIAYTDGTEKITQLNRPAENNLLKQVEYLTDELYGQLGLTKGIFDGTADEAAMLNYHERTIKPILKAVTEGYTRTFLTKTAQTQGQRVVYIRDPFSLVPVSQLADIADKFTRNEIGTSNEIRSVIGWRPSKDPKANELRNKNIPAPEEGGDSQDGS